MTIATVENQEKVKEGIEFLLSHFEGRQLREFRLYLADVEIRKRITEDNKKRVKNSVKNPYHLTIQYEWIEKLLETPIEDGRKYALWRILCPYLVNIKKMSPEESFLILDN
ncbi:MAG: hypothetical protein ACXW07_07765 [Nitrososphaeraceae archaeon]